jgi:solute carrier family 35, member F5
MFARSYALGILFIVLVAFIWAASSVLVQYLYRDQAFHSPFLLTYIGVSLFTLWLPTKFTTDWFKTLNWTAHNDDAAGVEAATVYRDIPSLTNSETDDELDFGTNSGSVESGNDKLPWTNEQHLRAALYIAPVWFVANWTYNASLAYTSITSSTVLASTGSLFTLLFAVVARDETFSWPKLAGVLLGVLGSGLTTWHDATPTNSSPFLLGDVLGLVSAVGYGAYAVQTTSRCTVCSSFSATLGLSTL